ncbi:hypothetical protein FJU08_20200 [Martelella alba]|uniref:Tetratricopeptide repeat protein n=1 Tax=Martelella alba TaxID=2590451 RepID=A0A506TZ20_9HYPH|nr:hypothetical protein [Martelella alba]TPW27332.1 hypothetical protein FJU08_20200 [Martelella alba]
MNAFDRQAAQRALADADRALMSRDFATALGGYDQVFAMGLESWPMHVNAAQCHKRLGDLESAFRHFDRAFEIRRRPHDWAQKRPPAAPAAREPVNTVFVANLREQLAYIADHGGIDWFSPAIAEELGSVERLLSEFYGPTGSGAIEAGTDWVRALLTLAPCRPAYQADMPLLSPDMRIEEVPLSGDDRFYIIDNLFAPKALERLLDQLLRSTIWFDARAQRSYLGAHLHDGLATPFMLDVARTLRDVVERLVGPVVVAQLWAFRYLTNSKGIDIHADQGDWNLNVWPVSADNLLDNGDQGGMTIYDLRIGEDVPFDQYNSQPELNRSRIEKAKAASHIVPYRGNRAVVFPSKYLHKTNAAVFSDTFTGRRINVTLMADTISS